MTNLGLPDFSIDRLGKPKLDSPMQLSHVMDDFIANFVEDDERILFDSTLSAIRKSLNNDSGIPAFEAAGPRDKIYFDPKNSTAAIVTCGGLCPGLNDVIQGLVQSLYFHYGVRNILGIRYGYKGLVEQSNIEPLSLSPTVVADIHDRGGTFLGSSRGPQPIDEIIDFLVKRKINILFTIGGDGTQRGALALRNEIRKRGLEISIVGIPKTIDNDVMYVDKSFGFESAYSIAANTLLSAHAEAYGEYNGITIVKLMGRHSGFLAANATVASGEVNFCLIPEIPFDLDSPKGFLAAIEKRVLQRHHAVVVVAEGAGQELMSNDVSILQTGVHETDASGNVKLSDIGLYLHQKVKRHFEQKGIQAGVRYIDPSYIVRSLKATAVDRMFCLRLANNAVHAAMSGRTGMIVGHWNSFFTHIPIEAAVSQTKQLDPESDLWLSVLESTGQPNRMIDS